MSVYCTEQIISEDYADFILEQNSSFVNEVTSPDICYTSVSFDYIIAYVPIGSIPKDILHQYGYRINPNCFGLLDIGSLEASNVKKVRNIPTFNLNGEGVLIGIVDTGIDYTHSAFQYEDGTSRIVSIWDQTIQNGPPPSGFLFGTEYTQGQINEALQSDNTLSIVPSMDENGHGTFLAGIAAGTISQENNFSGVVPGAELVVVKLKPAKSNIKKFWRIPEDVLCYQANDIILGVEYLRDIALSLKRPISICIGLGTSYGSHSGNGVVSRFLSAISVNIGVAVVIGAGNEGNRGHHYLGDVGASKKSELVELKVGPSESGFTMELWGQAPNTFSIDILSPTGEYIPRIPARLGESRVIRFLFENTIIDIDYFLIETQTGDELIMLRFQNPSEGIWRFRVYSSESFNSKFHIWLPIHGFISENTFFTNPNPETTLTMPGATLRPIITSAYDHTKQSLYLNTSRGFTRIGVISPDICAPGVNLIGPDLGNKYRLGTGTSVAAAHTAGVAAMLLEWGIVRKNSPLLESVQIGNLLKLGATRVPVITYPDTGWGYGTLDIYNTFNTLRGGAPP